MQALARNKQMPAATTALAEAQLKDLPSPPPAPENWQAPQHEGEIRRRTSAEERTQTGHRTRSAARRPLTPKESTSRNWRGSAPPGQTPPGRNPPPAAHQKVQLSTVQTEAAQAHGQVVDAESTVAVHVELLEEGAKAPVLLGGLAQRPPAGARAPTAAAALRSRTGSRSGGPRGAAGTEHAAHHRGGQRAPRSRHRPTARSSHAPPPANGDASAARNRHGALPPSRHTPRAANGSGPRPRLRPPPAGGAGGRGTPSLAPTGRKRHRGRKGAAEVPGAKRALRGGGSKVAMCPIRSRSGSGFDLDGRDMYPVTADIGRAFG